MKGLKGPAGAAGTLLPALFPCPAGVLPGLGAVAEEFELVVATCQKLPFMCCLLQPAQELVFALPGVDLPEDGFDDGLAPGVDRLALLGFQFPGHAFCGGGVRRDPATGRIGDLVAVIHPGGRNEELG